MEQNTNDASRHSPLYTSICVFVVKYFHEVGHWFPVPLVPLVGGILKAQLNTFKGLHCDVMELKMLIFIYFFSLNLFR